MTHLITIFLNQFILGASSTIDCFDYDTEYTGTLLVDNFVYTSVYDCQSWCVRYPGCQTFEYLTANKHCRLKSGTTRGNTFQGNLSLIKPVNLKIYSEVLLNGVDI